MSCVGKTTFSKQLIGHHYYCFDAMFQWHVIETLGVSIFSNLELIQKQCCESKFILDGWSLSDKDGFYLPKDSCVYVIYAPYDNILNQYRIPVVHHEEFKLMFNKWYHDVDYDKLPGIRYFLNSGKFIETDRAHFLTIV